MRESSVYEGWDLDRRDDALPERSRLYRLQPIAAGTAEIESLTGYIARLAEAHNVSPGALLMRELLPRVQRQSRAVPPRCTFIYDAYVVNGIGGSPRRWVRVLETLTGSGPLQALTMLSWRPIVSARHLLRSNRAWCPQCFAHWRQTGRIVYEPLLWAIRCVSVCPTHDRQLEHCCPHCNRSSPMLTAKSRPGYCFRCRRWLGTPGLSADRSRINVADLKAANGVGELLAMGSALQQPPAACLKDNLKLCIDHFARGNQSRFARATGVSLYAIGRWLDKTTCVSLDSFLCMCIALRISSARFLTQPILVDDPAWEGARQLFTRQHRPQPRRQGTADGPDRQKFTRERIQETLAAMLQTNPPPPMLVVARSVGRTQGHLRTMFPDLYRQIKQRHVEERRNAAAQRRLRFQAEIRVAILDLCERGVSPSRSHVLAAIPNPSMRCCHIVDRQIVRTLGELRIHPCIAKTDGTPQAQHDHAIQLRRQ
jgi:hypothetical protein